MERAHGLNGIIADLNLLRLQNKFAVLADEPHFVVLEGYLDLAEKLEVMVEASEGASRRERERERNRLLDFIDYFQMTNKKKWVNSTGLRSEDPAIRTVQLWRAADDEDILFVDVFRSFKALLVSKSISLSANEETRVFAGRAALDFPPESWGRNRIMDPITAFGIIEAGLKLVEPAIAAFTEITGFFKKSDAAGSVDRKGDDNITVRVSTASTVQIAPSSLNIGKIQLERLETLASGIEKRHRVINGIDGKLALAGPEVAYTLEAQRAEKVEELERVLAEYLSILSQLGPVSKDDDDEPVEVLRL